MISRALQVTCLVVLASFPVLAQDTPKVEIFGGYSWAGGNFNGVDTSITGNINKWFGVMADFSAHFGSEQHPTFLVHQAAQTFQAGPRISYRGKRLTAFGYALFGTTRFRQSATVSGQHLSESDSGLTSTYGGGLDITVNEHIAIRAIQLDYFRPNFFDEAHNRYRLAFGLVFRLGKR